MNEFKKKISEYLKKTQYGITKKMINKKKKRPCSFRVWSLLSFIIDLYF